MAAVTITASANYDDTIMLGLLNGENVTINNGAKLTINADPSGSLNAAYLGSIIINDGELHIDGTKTRMVDFLTASVLPVVGDICTCTATSASGQVIAVTGTVASGNVRLRSITGGTGVFTATAITFTGGKTATAAAADKLGFLVIIGEETDTITTTRQATVRMTGEWYILGVSNGAAAQTMTHYTTDVLPAIWVETGNATNVYEVWLNAGGRWAAGLSNGERGKLFSMANGTATITFSTATIVTTIPPNGARVRVPNVHLASVAAAAASAATRTVNAVLATRYDMTTTASGVIIMDKIVGAGFYPSIGQAYSVSMTNCGFLHQIAISEISSTCTLDNVGVGGNGTADTIAFPPLTITTNNSSTTVANSSFYHYTAATTGSLSIITSQNVTLTNVLVQAFAKASISVDVVQINASSKINTNNLLSIGGRVRVLSSDRITLVNTLVSDAASGPAVTTNTQTAVAIDTASKTIKVDGLNVSPTGAAPRNSLVQISNSSDIKLRNFGTASVPINAGAQIGVTVELTQNTISCEMSRIYCTNTRLGTYTTSNSNKLITLNNVTGDANDVYSQLSLDGISKGIFFSGGVLGNATGITTAITAVFGSHFYDMFTAATTGLLGIHMTEKTGEYDSSISYSITAGTPVFDAKGNLLMRTTGDVIEYAWSYKILGHTAFANLAHTLLAVNPANHAFAYQVDTGAGYSGTWVALAPASISAVAISPTVGFRLKLRITTTTGAVTNSIAGITIPTVCTATSQNTLYPLDVVSATVSLTGLQINSEVRIFRTSDSVELAFIEDSTTTFNYIYEWTADVAVYIVIHNVRYEYVRLDNIILSSTGLSAPIQQRFDRNYSGIV